MQNAKCLVNNDYMIWQFQFLNFCCEEQHETVSDKICKKNSNDILPFGTYRINQWKNVGYIYNVLVIAYDVLIHSVDAYSSTNNLK